MIDIYDTNFPIQEYILKDNVIKSKGLKKSFKKKKRLYIRKKMNLSTKPKKSIQKTKKKN